jgi:hypothetical protein
MAGNGHAFLLYNVSYGDSQVRAHCTGSKTKSWIQKWLIQCGPAPATHFPKLPLANLLSNTSKLRAFFAIPEVFLFFYAGVDE